MSSRQSLRRGKWGARSNNYTKGAVFPPSHKWLGFHAENRMISLDIFGDPVPKKRARTFNNHGKIVTWDSQDKLKEGYKWQIRSQYREEPITTPVIMDVVFMMPIPKSTSKVKQRAMLNGTYHHMCKPDVDNLVKFACDVLNNVVLKDDSQIVEMRAKKIYSTKPGTFMRIIPVENQCNLPRAHADT